MNAFDRLPFSQYFTIGVSAEKRDQIDKKFFFELINDLYQMTKSTSILLRNFFLKKKSIWSLFPALTLFFQMISGNICLEKFQLELFLKAQLISFEITNKKINSESNESSENNKRINYRYNFNTFLPICKTVYLKLN